MVLNYKQAYLATFQFLDELYDQNPNDTLGDILGSMNPFLFAKSGSADPATWEDWVTCAKKIRNEEYLTDEDAFEVMLRFLEYNQEEFNDDLTLLVQEIKPLVNDDRWRKHVSKVALMP